jgi:hypothetical protein
VNVFIRLSDHSAARGGTRLVRGSPHLGRLPNASFDPALVGAAAGVRVIITPPCIFYMENH